MLSGAGRKQENPEETHMDMRLEPGTTNSSAEANYMHESVFLFVLSIFNGDFCTPF